MPVTFRCKRSGNTVSFSNENDIEGLRKHEGYEEVTAAPVIPQSPQVEDKLPESTARPKIGRPRKGG